MLIFEKKKGCKNFVHIWKKNGSKNDPYMKTVFGGKDSRSSSTKFVTDLNITHLIKIGSWYVGYILECPWYKLEYISESFSC